MVRRWAAQALERVLDGRVTIGAVGGALWHAVELRDVTVTMPDGRPVLRVQRVRVTFALTDLLRSRYRIVGVSLLRPVVVLEQGADGRWNVGRLMRLGGPRPRAARPYVELLDARVLDGTLIVRERPRAGHVNVRTLDGLDADLARLRISHPDSTAVVASVRSLAARMYNPDILVRKADGLAVLDGDSLRLAFDHVALPATSGAVSALVRLGGPRTALDASINFRRLDVADLRGLAPWLPRAGEGSLALRLRLRADGSTEADVRDANLRSGRSAVAGKVTLTVGVGGGVSLRRMDLVLRPLDLAQLAPYVRSLPVRGLVRGRLRGAGSLTSLAVDGDLTWADEAVAGTAVNLLRGRGRLLLGGPDALAFEAFTLDRADFDLRTVRRYAPPLVLDGRLQAAGSLEGPWRDASFRGTLEQVGEGGLATRLHGGVRLGLSDPVRLDADLVLDSLSLALLHRTYPWVPLLGTVTGRARLHGPVTALGIDAGLRGPPGMLTVAGTIGGGDSVVTLVLEGGFDSLDLNAVSAAAPPSALAGRWAVDLRVPHDTAQSFTGTARVGLDPGIVAAVAVSGGGASVRLSAVRVDVDSARVDFAGGLARGSGGLGRGGGLPSELAFQLRADTVGYLEPLVRWMRRAVGDSSDVRLDGAALVNGRMSGTTRLWQLDFTGSAQAIRLGGNAGRGIRAAGRLTRGARGVALIASGAADTLVALGLTYAPVGLTLSGSLDSVTLRASAGFHVTSAVRASLTLAGDSAARRIRLDSLDLDLPARSWHLVRPARLVVTDEAVRADTIELRPRSGSGLVRAAGELPRSGEVGEGFTLAADSVPVVDLYALLQRDTTGVAGAMSGRVRLAGSAEAPVMEMQAVLSEGRFGDYRLPLLRVEARYRDQRLTLDGGLGRDTVRLFAVTGSVPLDLALRPVSRRQLPGPLSIVVHADSLDMTVLDPLTTIVSDLSGALSLDARVGGTWDRPTFSGFVDVRGAAMRIPALGARYADVDALLVLENDRMRVERGIVRSSGGGRLDVAGEVRFASLTKPVLDLTLNASQFAAYNISDFGALTGSGSLTLRGPAIGATLSGRLDVDAGYLQFRDLVEKRIVSLDDPELRALVDSNLARASELGPAVHTVFVDSLRIEGLTVTMGSDVWMRSSEANIQLSGDFDVRKWFEDGAQRYRLDGTLHAVRGTYRLSLGRENSFLAITREFRVTRGTVRFFGSPSFNPELDILAEHVVRTVQRSQLTVRALIGGSLQYPELRLESDQRPPLTETEIVSYLMFGQPPSELGPGSTGGRSEVLLAQAVGSSIVGGVGQALVSELGLPLDYLTIVPGAGPSQNVLGVSTARVEAGAQLGERTFLTLNAGLCEVLTARVVGATLEYRLTGRWTAGAAFEPVIQECGTTLGRLTGLTARFQFGFDLFWQQGIR